jgi:putative tryptophan/tyrosine transport system substrate-binding protein
LSATNQAVVSRFDDHAIAVAGRPQSAGLIALPDSFLNSRHEMIVALTATHHLPAIYAVSEFTRSGGLIAYGIERADLFRALQLTSIAS